MPNFLKNKYIRDFLIFAACWLFYGIIANIWIQFPDYDWYNYQNYNAWAFLNHRIGADFLAANYRSYYNPYINVLQYLTLLKLNNHPRLFLFLSTIDGAFLLFLTYKIGDIILSFSKKWKNIFIFLSVLYVSLSPIMFEVMDFSRYDGYIAVLELLSFYILLKNLFVDDSKKRTLMILLSGSLLGLAAGLKLTALIYCITFFLLISILYKKIDKPLKTLTLFISSSVILFICVDGYWLYTLYKYFHNPLFPHFNNIFKSEYYNNLSVISSEFSQYRPRNITEYIFYPFFKSINLCFGHDDKFWDSRYAINFICIVLLMILSCFKKISLNKECLFLSLFILISYYIDISIYGNYRFIMATSVLFGLMLVCFLLNILDCQKFSNYKYSLLGFVIILFFVYINQNLGYKHFLPANHSDIKKVLSIENLGIKDNSYVFTTFATSAVISNQNKNVKYMGYELSENVFEEKRQDLGEKTDLMFGSYYIHSKYLEKEIRDILNSASSNVYVLLNNRIWNEQKQKQVYEYSLKSYSKNHDLKNCRPVYIKLFNNVYDELTMHFCEYQ